MHGEIPVGVLREIHLAEIVGEFLFKKENLEGISVSISGGILGKFPMKPQENFLKECLECFQNFFR